MYVCHAIGPHLVERGTGSVINVASVAGVSAAPFLAPYGAAKAGLISLTKSLAVEWAAQGVRVNALCPGWTATDLNRNLWEDETAGPATVATVPMRRWGRADEMSGPAVFLASDGVVVHDRPGAGHGRRPDRHGLTVRERPYSQITSGGRCISTGHRLARGERYTPLVADLLGPPLLVVALALG